MLVMLNTKHFFYLSINGKNLTSVLGAVISTAPIRAVLCNLSNEALIMFVAVNIVPVKGLAIFLFGLV